MSKVWRRCVVGFPHAPLEPPLPLGRLPWPSVLDVDSRRASPSVARFGFNSWPQQCGFYPNTPCMPLIGIDETGRWDNCKMSHISALVGCSTLASKLGFSFTSLAQAWPTCPIQPLYGPTLRNSPESERVLRPGVRRWSGVPT